MKPRLVSTQRYMLIQLTQELAFTAAEAFTLTSRRQKHAEHFTLGQQRGRDERFQPAAQETLWKWEGDRLEIGFVHQVALHTSRQPVLIDSHVRLLSHGELNGQSLAVPTDTGDNELVRFRFVQADRTEVCRQVLLQGSDH